MTDLEYLTDEWSIALVKLKAAHDRIRELKRPLAEEIIASHERYPSPSGAIITDDNREYWVKAQMAALEVETWPAQGKVDTGKTPI